jgi:folate-dependent phosphoribosylglycinamide formyltransferase PurN
MILCGRSPRHLYVANRLCEHAHPVAIVQETGTQWSAKQIVRQLRRGGPWRKAWRLLRDRRRYAGGGEARFFFGAGAPRLTREDLLVQVPHVNHPDVVVLADRLQPDVIAVFGTSLIRSPLLSRGRLGIFNLHGGLSPHYRGADCTFWALYNGEPDQVGCTLHRIDSGIDTGTIIAHVRPEVGERDDELTLFWRGIRDSAEVYIQMLERLARGDRVGAPQREKGRLYQVKDRTWRAERQLAARMRNGLLRGLHLPARVRWFHGPGTMSTSAELHVNLPERQEQ